MEMPTYLLWDGIRALIRAELIRRARGVVGHICVLGVWCLRIAEAGDLV